MKKYIALILLFPLVVLGQTDVPLYNKTTKVWVKPTPAEIATANFYGLTTNPLSQFAATSSAQFAGVINDETGTGSVVLSTSPTFVTSVFCPAINGGIAANDDISIQGTTNPTRASSYVLLQPSGGNVGIGVSSATGRLDVQGDGGNPIQQWLNSSSVAKCWVSADGRFIIGADAVSAAGNALSIRGNSTSLFPSSGANSSLFRVEQTGNASAFLLYADSALALTNTDGLFRVHIDGGSSTAPCFTLRQDGSGPHIRFQGSSGSTVAQVTAAGVFEGSNIINGAVSFSGITADPNADRIAFWDDSATSMQWLSLSGLTITGTSLAVDAASESAAGKLEIANQSEAEASTSDALAMTPLKVKQQRQKTERVPLTSDGQIVTVGQNRLIILEPDVITPQARTFTITDGEDGQELTLLQDGSGFAPELVDTGNVVIMGDWIGRNSRVLNLVYGDGRWTETSRSESPSEYYSGSETIIGEWEGANLYRKTIDVGTLPNTTSTNDAHGISGGSFGAGSIKRIYGYCNDGTTARPIPLAHPTASSSIAVWATSTNIVITTGDNYSTFSGYVTLEYTK